MSGVLGVQADEPSRTTLVERRPVVRTGLCGCDGAGHHRDDEGHDDYEPVTPDSTDHQPL